MSLLASLVNTATSNIFGSNHTIYYANNSSVSVESIFYKNFELVEMQEGIQISSFVPALEVQASLFTVLPKQNDRAQIGNTTYTIRDVQPNGLGLLRLILIK